MPPKTKQVLNTWIKSATDLEIRDLAHTLANLASIYPGQESTLCPLCGTPKEKQPCTPTP